MENLALGDRDGIGKTYALLTRGQVTLPSALECEDHRQTAAKQLLNRGFR